MQRLLQPAIRLFDWLDARWESIRMQRMVGTSLTVIFLVALLVIEVNRLGLLPRSLAELLPTNHFYAVDLAFTLLLLVEVAALIFSLVRSVSQAVGIQFQILSLILLRESFKALKELDEPIIWEQVQEVLAPMLIDAAGALLIFVILGFYYRIQRHRPITTDAQDQASFIAAKKLISLGLLVAFLAIAINDLVLYLQIPQDTGFFEKVYTVLVFTDVLIVLIALRYSSTYHVVFRNSGFAVTTLFIRLALIAPPPFNALIGVGVALFALGLTFAYNAFAPDLVHEESPSAHHSGVEHGERLELPEASGPVASDPRRL